MSARPETANALYAIGPGCIACGACALLAPRVFVVNGGSCKVVRQPQEAPEGLLVDVALLNCPTSAISRRAQGNRETGKDVSTSNHGSLYATLAEVSEQVRWGLPDIDWSALRPELASDPVRALVRRMAFSEHTTFSATQKFMQVFATDVAFTQWLAVWFYEETRHPHVLGEWLRRLGEPVDDGFVLKGRVSTPFMKSLTGTLVTNVISEVAAAHAYQVMASTVAEPVLAALARNICGDEARHASAFFQFARRRIERAAQPERERLDAIKVLHFWLNQPAQVTHPIGEMIAGPITLSFDFDQIRRRVTRMVGLLVGLPLRTAEDVANHLRLLTARVHAEHRASHGQ